ncbi:MAG: GNAT family N-acetyltransferase [Ruminococcus sp.]|nr:GNAT family N-acetyltransferase [Ruminococcus sp.]
MLNISVRKAIFSDAQSICNINKNSLGYDYPLKNTKEQIKKILTDDKTILLVSVVEDNIVTGYIEASIYDTAYSGTYVNIMALAVDGKHQKNGCGKMLLTAVEDWAKNNNAVGIRLESSTFRTEAHKFYEACGYECLKEHKNFKRIF